MSTLDCGDRPEDFTGDIARQRPDTVLIADAVEMGASPGDVALLEAEDLPLGQAVGAMAIAAALQDPRFPPLEQRELRDLEIEISALTPLERVAGPGAVVIGRDGVEIRKSGRAAVFLPQVPVEQGWDRPTLMRELCRKAGLPEDAWKSGAEFYTFRSVVFRESEFH